MKLSRFPKTIKIELEDHERQALDAILKQHPVYCDDRQLIAHVVAEGISALLGRENEHHVDGGEPTPAERMERRLRQMSDGAEPPRVSTASTLPPFPKITRRYKDPNKEHVENYVACSVTEDIRQRLQLLLDSQPELDLEQMLTKLIDLGLEQAEEHPGALQTNPAEEFERSKNETKVAATSPRAAPGEDPFTLDFPKTLRIELDDEIHRDLRELANLLPHTSDEQLVIDVLERGVEAALGDARAKSESPWRRAFRQRRLIRRAQLRAIACRR
jgi:hypothetical protein